MPLPERPNVGEFTPTVEPPPARRVAFRWRVVPITLLLLPAIVLLAGSGIMLGALVMHNPFRELNNRPWFYNEAEFLVHNVVYVGGPILVDLGMLLGGMGCCAAMWAFAKGKWRVAAAICIALIAAGVVAPSMELVLRWVARALAGLVYPGQPLG